MHEYAVLGRLTDYSADHFLPRPDYRNDPVRWIGDRLGETVWSGQTAVAESVRDNRYTAVRSGHDVGKSYIASRLGAWWLDAHPPGEAFLVTTAPSAAQVSAILWREITRAHSAARKHSRPLRGKVTRAGYPQWHIDGELVGYGRKPADYEQSAFQGIHARYVLVIMDEAGGIPRALYDAVDALATNQYARVLAIGNPDDASNHFATVCRPDSGWDVMHLDCLRSPNLTREAVAPFPALMALMEAESIRPSQERVPDRIRPLLVSAQWVAERIHRWAGVTPEMVTTWAETGEDVGQNVRTRCAASPLFQVKVRGEFSDPGDHNVIPLGWAQQAMNRWRDLRWQHQDDWLRFGDSQPGRRVAGVDVAREGADETCVFLRQGRLGIEFRRYPKQDTMETVDRVREHVGMFTGAQAVVDAIGIGAGVVDRLRQMKREGSVIADVVAFTASERSDRRDLSGSFRFRNDRAAAWWHLRELLDPARGSDVCLPYDDQLLADLTTPQWYMHQGSILTVEPKEDIRKRLGRSPDVGDACVMAFWVAGTPLPLVERPSEVVSAFDMSLEEWVADMPYGASEWRPT